MKIHHVVFSEFTYLVDQMFLRSELTKGRKNPTALQASQKADSGLSGPPTIDNRHVFKEEKESYSPSGFTES